MLRTRHTRSLKLIMLAAFTAMLFVSQSATAAQVCVLMDNSADMVAGMQVDIAWDGSCMSAAQGSGGSAQCQANRATGKTANSRIQGQATMRVLFFSMENSDPIPDGELFCCAFEQKKTGCCGLQMGRLIASDSTGRRLNDPGVGFVATVDGQSCASLSPTESSSGGPAARGPLPRQQQPNAPVVESGPGNAPGEQAPAAQAPAPQPPAQQPPAQQQVPPAQRAAGAPPIGVPAPTPPAREQPRAGEQPDVLAQQQRPGEAEAPSAAAPRYGQAAPGQVAPAGTTPGGSPAATSAPAETPTSAGPPPTNTKPPATKTPTVALPTTTPTSGGFFSGCHVQQR